MRSAVVQLSLMVILTESASRPPAADWQEGFDRASEAQKKTIDMHQQNAPSFELAGIVHRPTTFTLERLRQYPPAEVELSYGKDKGESPVSFRGVPLWDLVREVGVVTEQGRKNDLLRKYLVVTGRDGYQVVISMAEILPDFAGQRVIVAYEGNTQLLGPNLGMLRVVVPGDKRRGRYVSQITRIMVRNAEP